MFNPLKSMPKIISIEDSGLRHRKNLTQRRGDAEFFYVMVGQLNMSFLKNSTVTLLSWVAIFLLSSVFASEKTSPNFLIFMTDDQSYWHTSANGDPVVSTPNFDRVAREGINFTHCFSDAPSCTPSRGAFLSGRHVYQLEEASVLQGAFPAKFKTFQELLWDVGYHCGYTGKSWGPGMWNATGRTFDP
ncbi:MAG: sulfatase-like hydrolase/transferase, partial [Pseudomonadota bacterium]